MTKKVKETTAYDNFIGKTEKVDDSGPRDLSDLLGIEKEDKEWKKNWVGMPEFEQKENPPFKTLYIHFRNEEDFNEFVKKYGNLDSDQTITLKTKSMWYPHLDRDENSLKRWFEE